MSRTAINSCRCSTRYDERSFLPIHVYDTERSRPVAFVLRPGKTPGGVEVRAHLRRLVRHIRKRRTKTRITFRGDGHYARTEAMQWCEDNAVDYVFGLPGSKPLLKKMDEAADAVRTERAALGEDVVHDYTQTRHAAKSWSRERRAVARIEATALGLDIRFVITNLEHGSPEWIYDSLYCARGQMDIDQAWRLSRLCSGGGSAVGEARRHAAPGRRRGAYRLQRGNRLVIGAHQHGAF
jgi:hypothetical protein